METYLIPGRAKNFVFRLYDLDGEPVIGQTPEIRILRYSAGGPAYEWNDSTSSWDAYSAGTELWADMTDNGDQGLYSYILGGANIDAWYDQEFVVLFRVTDYPSSGDIVNASEVYKVIEKVIEYTEAEVSEDAKFINQDGWWTDAGVLVPWGDERAGYVFDDTTGDRLVGVRVAMHTIVDGEPVLTSQPAKLIITGWDGNWSGWVAPGTYRFYFFKDHFVDYYVDRTVG